MGTEDGAGMWRYCNYLHAVHLLTDNDIQLTELSTEVRMNELSVILPCLKVGIFLV